MNCFTFLFYCVYICIGTNIRSTSCLFMGKNIRYTRCLCMGKNICSTRCLFMVKLYVPLGVYLWVKYTLH